MDKEKIIKIGKICITVVLIFIFILQSFLFAFAIGQQYEYITYFRASPDMLENMGGGQRFSMFALMNFAAIIGRGLFFVGFMIYVISIVYIKNRMFIITCTVLCVVSLILLILEVMLPYII